MFLEFHRHFTRSFIPVGSAVVAGVLYGLGRRWLGLSIWKCWFFCTLGFGTHGLLDAATSGTSLLWPLSDTRFSLSIISIFDPLFTLPLIALVGAGVLKRDGRYGRAAPYGPLLFICGWISASQAHRMAKTLAESRGHEDVRLVVKPTLATYFYGGPSMQLTVGFMLMACFLARRDCSSTSMALKPARDFPWLNRAPIRPAI